MELSPGKSEFLCLHNSHVKLLFINDKPQVTQFKHNDHLKQDIYNGDGCYNSRFTIVTPQFQCNVKVLY